MRNDKNAIHIEAIKKFLMYAMHEKETENDGTNAHKKRETVSWGRKAAEREKT